MMSTQVICAARAILTGLIHLNVYRVLCTALLADVLTYY